MRRTKVRFSNLEFFPYAKMSYFSGNYIDSSRNIAVNLDSRELKKTLKKIKQDEDGVFDNTGIVNR